MKKQKIPLLPLYIADTLMLIIVLVVMTANISAGVAMSTSQLFFCTLIVFFGMILALMPYYFEFKKSQKNSSGNSQEAEDNFKLIFDELVSLRLSIADTIEKIDNDNDKLANVSILEQALIEQQTAVKNKFKEHKQKIESLKIAIEDLNEKISAQNSANSEEVSQILSTLNQLKDTILDNAQYVDDDIVEDDCEPVEQSQDIKQEQEPSSLISRAFNNATYTKNSVDKFISRNSQPQETLEEIQEATDEEEKSFENDFIEIEKELEIIESPNEDFPETSVEPFADNGELIGDFTDVEAKIAGLDDNDNFPQTTDDNDFPQVDDVDIEEIENETQVYDDSIDETVVYDEDINQESSEPIDDSDKKDFFDVADSPIKVESAKKNKKEDDTDNLPFADLPPPRVKQSPKKGDAVITLNTIIGIGNKPYLQGDIEELSVDSGVCMEYIEIGIWRYIIPNLEQDLHFKILKNNQVLPLGESEFTISPNQKLTLNLAFPLE